ncbi:unnamed protein product [Acanthosepion pharaonis]|uniref:Uncharacterized protein n=1 Tax=Acanthosepion pharaonis TaxID=158019 RepID=A0A812BVT0_ACAPH|nr:unnamed protein product [Sepia pharaonis]
MYVSALCCQLLATLPPMFIDYFLLAETGFSPPHSSSSSSYSQFNLLLLLFFFLILPLFPACNSFLFDNVTGACLHSAHTEPLTLILFPAFWNFYSFFNFSFFFFFCLICILHSHMWISWKNIKKPFFLNLFFLKTKRKGIYFMFFSINLSVFFFALIRFVSLSSYLFVSLFLFLLSSFIGFPSFLSTFSLLLHIPPLFISVFLLQCSPSC